MWKILGLGAGAIVLTALTMSFWPPSDAAEQDRCTFGTVGNARYLELLARAKTRAATDWPVVSQAVLEVADRAAAERIEDQFDELSKGMTSISERLAAFHAVMRANHANYVSTSPSSVDAYAQVQRDKAIRPSSYVGDPTWDVAFDYRMDMGWISPLEKWRGAARIIVMFMVIDSKIDPSTRRAKYPRNSFDVLFHAPSLEATTDTGLPVAQGCPSVPSAEWEATYLAEGQGSGG